MTDQKTTEHIRIAEAALFVSGRAMGLDELGRILGIASPGYVKKVIEALAEEYAKGQSALEVVSVGDKYALNVKNEYASKVSELAGAPEISKGALRILAYVGRNEPVMQSSIVKAFGSSTYDYMHELLEKDFVTAQRKGRSKRVETTQKFREYFNLQDQE